MARSREKRLWAPLITPWTPLGNLSTRHLGRLTHRPLLQLAHGDPKWVPRCIPGESRYTSCTDSLLTSVGSAASTLSWEFQGATCGKSVRASWHPDWLCRIERRDRTTRGYQQLKGLGGRRTKVGVSYFLVSIYIIKMNYVIRQCGTCPKTGTQTNRIVEVDP